MRSLTFVGPVTPGAGSIRLNNRVVVLDTSVLVDALTGAKRSLSVLRILLSGGERIVVPSLVMYEWLRGPRTSVELADQEDLFPAAVTIPFDAEDAALCGRLYRSIRRARSREIDIAIAACAIRQEARLWTLNLADFSDLPGLNLLRL